MAVSQNDLTNYLKKQGKKTTDKTDYTVLPTPVKPIVLPTYKATQPTVKNNLIGRNRATALDFNRTTTPKVTKPVASPIKALNVPKQTTNAVKSYANDPVAKVLMAKDPTSLATWKSANGTAFNSLDSNLKAYINDTIASHQSKIAAKSPSAARLMAGGSSAINSATFGLSDNKFTPQKVEHEGKYTTQSLTDQLAANTQKAHPIASTLGNLTGSLVGGGITDVAAHAGLAGLKLGAKAVTKTASKEVATKTLPTVKKIVLQKAGKEAAFGATSNTLYGAALDATQGKDGKTIAKDALLNAGIGGVLGGALGGITGKAASKKISPLPTVKQKSAIPQSVIDRAEQIKLNKVETQVDMPATALNRGQGEVLAKDITNYTKKIELPYAGQNKTDAALKVKDDNTLTSGVVKADNTITQPVSKFRTNTLERSQPKEALKQLDPKEFDYIPETKVEWQDQAVKNIKQNRAKVVSDIQNATSINGGVQAHEAAIISHDLLAEAEKTGNYADYKNFLQTVTEKTRETARALKGTDTAWDKTTADGAVLQAQRVVDKVESDLKEANPKLIEKVNTETKAKIKELQDLGENPNYGEVRDLIKKQYKIPVLEDADIKFIVDKMNQANKEVEGSYQQRLLRSQVLNLIANKIPATGVEKVQAMQRIMMLLNPKTTIVRNPLGNVMLGALESVKNVPATALDKAISLKTGKRTTTINPLVKGKAETQGMAQGMKEWALDIKNRTSTAPTGGQADMPKKTIIFSENHNIANAKTKSMMDTAGKIGNGTHQVVSRMLQVGDRPFYQGAYNARLAELKLLNKTTEITEDMKLQANEYALERTFQNDSWLSRKMLKLGANKTDPMIWRVMVHLIMPFKQTPANILDKFIDYSGVGGIAKATGHALATKGKGTFNQKYFVDTMGRGLTGGGLAVLGYMMAQKGLVTGGYDQNKKVEGFESALGKGNYAFKIGDTYQTFDWALPASASIALGAAFYEAASGSKEGQNATIKGLEGAVNLLFNSTVLQGPSNLMGGYSPAASIGKSLLGLSTQATPTLGKQISQLIDPYTRETYDPNTMKQVLNKTIARLPFASKTLPIKQDVFGNDIKAFQGKNNVFNVMLNPGMSTTYKPDKAQTEIERLYKKTGSANVLPSAAVKNVTVDGQKIVFTTDQYTKYAKTQGQTGYKIVKDIVNENAYQSLSDEEKSSIIQSAYDYAGEYAKKQTIPDYEMKGWKAEAYAALQKGLPTDEYIIAYNTVKDIESDKNAKGKSVPLSASRKKKAAIDAMPDLTREQKKMLYDMFDVSSKLY